MTTYLTNYLDTRYKTYTNDAYSGVVRISYNGYYGTGTLLYDGVSVLTSAHLFDGVSSSSLAIVHLQTSSGNVDYDAASVQIYDYYDAAGANGDLAIVRLDQPALQDATRSNIYREDDEIGQEFTMVGYGTPGSGTYGADETYEDVLKLKTQNTFDADFYTISESSSTNLEWSPWNGSQLAADFDNGNTQNDAIGLITGNVDMGLGTTEGLIAPGDSGGPAFIGNDVAGVATYVASIDVNGDNPDINTSLDSSFGEIASWQRVSYFQEWIDKTIRSGYVDAPTKSEDVVKSIEEGTSGEITTVYFLVEYTGIRSNIDEAISVDYTTRDGTARAGEDYIAAEGTLMLYLDETQAVIPVEIIGDNLYEEDEYFYLDIYNPNNGSFGDGVITLSAMRTIINDDFIA